jgi:hypothetical protein
VTVAQDIEIEAPLGRLTDEIRRNTNGSLVRQVGVTLYGPPPHTLIPEISQSEFVESTPSGGRAATGSEPGSTLAFALE